MNTQTVNVTAEIIERGRRRGGFTCPVGLALTEAVGPCWVRSYGIKFDWLYKSYQMSGDLSHAIETFDTTGTMSPMTLIIDHDAKTITVQT